MACGSCGQRYNQDSAYQIVGSSKGTSQGVITKAELEVREALVRTKLAAIEKKKGRATAPDSSPNPVVGQSGPANEPE